MNILKLLQFPIFELPKHSYKNSFPHFLEECYGTFLKDIDKLDEGTIVEKLKTHRQTLELFCNSILKSVNSYFEGFSAKAYFEFEDAMNLINIFLFPKTQGKLPFNEYEPYYRARIGSNKQFERHEMFHIPFEMREFVTTQRFSVPGLPCLYLSNSTYVCWEELKRPDINKMQISRFKLEDVGFNFLNIAYTTNSVCSMLKTSTSKNMLEYLKRTEQEGLDSMDSLALYFIMTWPLITACSIKVRKQDGVFKPEYIFPQFLLQWVTHNKKIDGIKYFSIEANISSKIDCGELINYAIPVKKVKENGYCEHLKNAFSLTQPVSWELLNLVNPNINQFNQDKLKANLFKLSSDTISSTLELIKGKPTQYHNTTFGKLELETSDMSFEKIQE